MLTNAEIYEMLGTDAGKYSLSVFASLPSTNSYIKEHADALPDGYAVIASNQTAGRGRMGRSFYSPEGIGIYMSILIKKQLTAGESVYITSCAAVAVCRAITECTGIKPGIKWVNDIFINGRKVCGILTEGSIEPANGMLNYAVLGIGINVNPPEKGFPKDIADTAGTVSAEYDEPLPGRLAAAVLVNFRRLSDNLHSAETLEEYRALCFIPGREIDVIRGGIVRRAKALDIDESFRLRVKYETGEEEYLSSGEISIRSAE